MPFAPRKQTDEELQQQTSSPNISGQSTSFSANVPGGNAGMAKPKAKSSGQYQNLQKYISANQEQAGQMAGKVASDVEGQVGQAQQAVGGITNQVQKTQAYDPNAAISRAGQLSNEEKQAYNAQKQTGGYTGAQDVYGLSGYQDAAKKATEAATTASLAGTEQGQKELLKKSYARPTYSGGASTLDQALIQYNQPAKQQISSLADKYKDLSSQFSGQFGQAQSAIEQSQAQAKANQAAIAQAEQKARGDLLGGIQSRATQMAQEAPQAQERFRGDISDDALTAETMGLLGLQAGQNLYGINLADYVNYNQTPINANAVATQQERQKYQDLMNLFGTPGTELSAQGPGIDVSPVQVNKAQLASDLAARQKEYENFRNQSAGQYYDFLNNVYKKGLTTLGGQDVGIPTSGAYWDQINNMSLAQLEQGGVPDSGNYGSVFQNYAQASVPEYIKYLQDKYQANRKVGQA